MRSLLAIALILTACSPTSPQPTPENPCGLPNFAQVRRNYYRGGQPVGEKQWLCLKQLMLQGRPKARLVIDKLNFDAEGSDSLAVALGFEVRDLAVEPRTDWKTLKEAVETAITPLGHLAISRMILAAEAVRDSSEEVDYGHCTHGRDRTGFFSGVVRMVADCWTKRDAFNEALRMGYRWQLPNLDLAWSELEIVPCQ